MKFYLQGFHTLAQGLSSHSKDLRAFIFGWLVLVLQMRQLGIYQVVINLLFSNFSGIWAFIGI